MKGISRRQFLMQSPNFAFGLTFAIDGAFNLRLAAAQQFPSQDIQLICGNAPGSGADVLVRFIADKMRPLTNRPIVVQNRAGALGNIATEFVARSKPDGHTLYIQGGSAIAANQHLFKANPLDASKALVCIGTMNKQPMLICVAAQSPHRTFAELMTAVENKGEAASYATANTSAKVVGALLKQAKDLKCVEVQYKTGAQYISDLTSGNVDFGVADTVLGISEARAGRFRILAVSTPARMLSAPEYPTLKELGVPVTLTSWGGAFVAAGTPPSIIHKLNELFNQVVSSNESLQFFNRIASDPWTSTADEAQNFFLEEIANWGNYVRIAKIEPLG